jgi:hypothetical protein
VILVGHTRWKAAHRLGLEQVPVHQTASLAEWDAELLPLELAELKALDFDLDLLGFSQDQLTEWLAPPANPGDCDPDDIPEPPDNATTQPGELIMLGNHRLLCADSSKAEDVDLLLDGAPVHLVNTDPPYNVRVEPRSNNAIAAGLSCSVAPRITRASTWPGTRGRRRQRAKSFGPRTGRWRTIS